MTEEQCKKGMQICSYITNLNTVIDILKTPECHGHIVVHSTYSKNPKGELVHNIKEHSFADKEICDAFIQILEEKKEKLLNEFKEL